MHLLPVAPGSRLLALNIAVFVSSSARATLPVAQLLVGLAVVAEKAEYDACQTRPPLASRASGTAAPATSFLGVVERTDIGGSFAESVRPHCGPVIESFTGQFGRMPTK